MYKGLYKYNSKNILKLNTVCSLHMKSKCFFMNASDK